jgi:hypothetical protein
VFGEAFFRGGVLTLLGGAERTTRVAEQLAGLVEREVEAARS